MKKEVLIVIPAYNESHNIVKVLNEIKKDADFADVIVVNDCSTDDTEDVLKKNKVNYLNNIFNMGYGGAVQSGIKYANENNYNYVIMLDADGQHIPKEAEKLYQYMKKHNVDIVIGSRYLKDMGYHCPFFRKIGTRIFSWMVKVFCHQVIKDLLSGFQCINRDVIKRYSKMGGYPEFPDANLTIEMLRSGYTFAEVPVKMRNREDGTSIHGGIIKPIKYMINTTYEIIFILLTVPKKEKK